VPRLRTKGAEEVTTRTEMEDIQDRLEELYPEELTQARQEIIERELKYASEVKR
jgi:hypothetical protein